MSISDEVLMAYADGELDSKTRAEVESAMATDPQVARRVAEHKALRNTLRATYDPVLDEPIPGRLLDAARAPKGRTTSNVIPIRRRRQPRMPLPYWGAIAASFVVGVLVWHFGSELYSPEAVVERDGQLLASGALDKALSTQLVRDQQAQSAVQIGVSFRSKNGSYCRTFQLHQADKLAGLACRDQGKWKLEVLAQNEASPGGHPEFRPAGSSLPPAIARAVDEAIEGEPLDAQGEELAKAGEWESR
jgi:hypothetical protein